MNVPFTAISLTIYSLQMFNNISLDIEKLFNNKHRTN